MDSFDRILKKLKTIIANGEKRIVNDKEVARALGLTPQNFSNLKQRNSIPTEYIMNFCAKNKISINWMFFDQLHGLQEIEALEYIELTYYEDINGACGGGAFNNDFAEKSVLNLPKYILNYLNYNPKDNNMHVINAIGDSMEPSIYEGNKILVDTNYRKLNKQNIFIISTTEGVFIKRIQLNGNNLILISDNQEYEDIVININDSNFQVIGKVVGII